MRRELTPELMDDPALDPHEHAHALRGLARLNALSRSDLLLWRPIREQARRTGTARTQPLSLLDIATGSADVPLGLARRAARAGVALELHACDLSATAIDHARAGAERAGVALDAWRQNAIAEPFARRFDVVTCSLFLHHLREDQAVDLLRNAAGATDRLLLVNDLRRTPLGLAAAWAISRLVTRSRVVHVDAVKSVRAAYTPGELLGLASRAGLEGATVRPRWPWRMLLSWRRP